MALVVLGNCNTLPMIQSVIQNGGGSLDIRATQTILQLHWKFANVCEVQGGTR
jgi:hypothetical protein